MQTAFLDIDPSYLLFTLMALGIFLAFTGIVQLLTRRESGADARNRRMRLLEKGATASEIRAILKPGARGASGRLPALATLSKWLDQSGLGLDMKRYLALCLVAGFGSGVGATVFLPAYQAPMIGLLGGIVLPLGVVLAARKQRMDKMVRQLPDALDLMARGLRVGHPLNTSIGAVAREMADPVASEFGLIFDQISYGDDLPDAFQEFAERIDLEDVHYLSSSIGIQHGTGGDLARVISVLSRVIRDRIALRRKIKAISAEGRLTAWFLSLLPAVIYFMTSTTSPSYYADVSGDPLFAPLMASIIGLTVLNALVLWKLVSFRV
ncbi:type II secretion system F family protein [Roseibacterium sp. SDUM158016]|uniref:type II secretion system F family protein n=1 Tax=Roseicyclus sediminis TaxID=2980997 RepID=UPI0021D03B07|nr:type II secretion system F family protein [Roseibacterium sp. SDUM158016]MCU4654266.1 type II secretion system F family protein [Roseibacterium sp. SDUM158016]